MINKEKVKHFADQAHQAATRLECLAALKAAEVTFTDSEYTEFLGMFIKSESERAKRAGRG